MGLKLESGLKTFFSKKLKQTIAYPLVVFFALLLYFSHSKNICNPTICRSHDTKIAQFGMRKILDNIQ
jgi:hypothetical protein